MIDRDRWNEVIAENSADTLENFCMLFPEPDAIPGDAPLVASMAVEFRGPLHGRFFVQAFGDVLAEATETLTVEETPDAAAYADVLGEITNVLCGNLLPEIFGTLAEFDITP
ncbi:MAG: chemotaxis protein CheX, partial [Planctomycetes bacterium]|nr:chemotaxis protein CheX [Planctomycetota bacterium]